MKRFITPCLLIVCCTMHSASFAQAQPKAPVIPEADGYVDLPHAKVPPDKSRTYRAVYDATKAAKDSSQLLPALNMAGSELNAFGVAGVPLRQVKFVVVFHGAALNGILDNEQYQAKFGIPNPNLPVLASMRKAGVKLFVCGQNLVSENIDPKVLSRDVEVASDALIVLMTYQNDEYALLSF